MNRDDVTLEEIFNVEYWTCLVPWLTVGNDINSNKDLQNHQFLHKNASFINKRSELILKKRFIQDGFFEVNAENESEAYFEIVNKIARGVEELVKHNWPPTFIYVYKEPFQLIRYWLPQLQRVNGGSVFLGNFFLKQKKVFFC